MNFFKLTWKYLLLSVILLILVIILSFLLQWDNRPDWLKDSGDGWVKALLIVFGFSAILSITIGGMVAANKVAPRYKSINQQFAVYRILRHGIAWALGIVVGSLFNGTIMNMNGYGQGILSATVLTFTLWGVMIKKINFSKSRSKPEKLLVRLFKTDLILSLIAGIVALFLILFWFAKGEPNYLKWATYAFTFQLAYLSVLFFFTKYYLK